MSDQTTLMRAARWWWWLHVMVGFAGVLAASVDGNPELAIVSSLLVGIGAVALLWSRRKSI